MLQTGLHYPNRGRSSMATNPVSDQKIEIFFNDKSSHAYVLSQVIEKLDPIFAPSEEIRETWLDLLKLDQSRKGK